MTALKDLIANGSFISAPGVFDPLSARVAEQSGANALYMTGYGVSASLLGKPDAGLVSYREMVDRVRAICEVTTCLLYTSPSPRDKRQSRMPSSA